MTKKSMGFALVLGVPSTAIQASEKIDNFFDSVKAQLFLGTDAMPCGYPELAEVVAKYTASRASTLEALKSGKKVRFVLSIEVDE
jgi:hypothetical protein